MLHNISEEIVIPSNLFITQSYPYKNKQPVLLTMN